MKTFLRLNFLLLFSITLLHTAQAQIGVKVGYNLSHLKYSSFTDISFNDESISGFQIGAVYHIKLGDRFSLQPEFGYNTNGGKSNFESTQIRTSYRSLRLDGLLNFNLLNICEELGLHLTGGFFTGYALNGMVDRSDQEERKIDFDEEFIFNRYNAGYVLGAGVKFNSFILSLRTSIGLTDLLDYSSITSISEINYKSREFSIIVTLLL